MENTNVIEQNDTVVEQVVETVECVKIKNSGISGHFDPTMQLAEEIDNSTQVSDTFPDTSPMMGQDTMSTPFDELNIAKSRQGNNINVNGKNFKTMEDFQKYMKKLQKKNEKKMRGQRPSPLAKLLLSRI